MSTELCSVSACPYNSIMLTVLCCAAAASTAILFLAIGIVYVNAGCCAGKKYVCVYVCVCVCVCVCVYTMLGPNVRSLIKYVPVPLALLCHCRMYEGNPDAVPAGAVQQGQSKAGMRAIAS